MSSFDSIVTYGLNDEILFSSWYYSVLRHLDYIQLRVSYIVGKFSH